MDDDVAVRTSALGVAFGHHRVLDGVDLEVRRGEVLALLGPNGAGKTTTVRVLTTLRRPTTGRATVAGFDVVRDPRRVRACIALTGQDAAVDDRLTGVENLRLMARMYHLPRRERAARVDDLVDAFDLADASDRLVRTYSGGMRRRLDLAVSLLARPQVLFLDEPTTGLDPRSRLAVRDLVRGVVDRGTTVLLTTQYLDEADRLADTIAVLDHGQVVARGSGAELKRGLGAAYVSFHLADLSEVRVPTDGSVGHVRHVLDDAERRGLDVVRWQVREPSLDEVFLALTGTGTGSTAEVAR